MAHGDAALADEQLMTTIYEALEKRHPRSRSHGRRSAPAGVVLRLLILKHVRDWSYETLEREGQRIQSLALKDGTRTEQRQIPEAADFQRNDWSGIPMISGLRKPG